MNCRELGRFQDHPGRWGAPSRRFWQKPRGDPTQDEVTVAEVIKIDAQRDLASVRPRSLPHRTVSPLQISSTDIEVGADVAAIGHPEGQR